MDDMSWANGAAQLSSAALQAVTNKKAMERAKKANMELNQQNFDLSNQLAQQNYERNLQQWQMENEYNSPSNQVKRNLEAGINPLWNGVTSTSANSPQLETIPLSGGSGVSAQAQSVNIGNLVQQFMSLKTQELQQDQIRADIELKESQASNYNILQLLNGTKNDKLRSGENFWQLNELFDNKSKELSAQYLQEKWLELMFDRMNIQPERLNKLKSEIDLLNQEFEFNKDINPLKTGGQNLTNELRAKQLKYQKQFYEIIDRAVNGEDTWQDAGRLMLMFLGSAFGLK